MPLIRILRETAHRANPTALVSLETGNICDDCPKTDTPALSQVALIVPQAPMAPRLLTLALQSIERLKPRIVSVSSASLLLRFCRYRLTNGSICSNHTEKNGRKQRQAVPSKQKLTFSVRRSLSESFPWWHSLAARSGPPAPFPAFLRRPVCRPLPCRTGPGNRACRSGCP